MLTIGWQEKVDLPELGLINFKAKIDTGARTSALHATDIEEFERDGSPWVRFRSEFKDGAYDGLIECPVQDSRDIKNTSGVPEHRIVIRTPICIADRCWQIDISLADRTGMRFRMIIGRTALRGHTLLVDPGKRFLGSGVPRKKPKKKKG